MPTLVTCVNSVSEAKKLIEAELVNRGLPFTKLTGKTVSFDHGSMVFIQVHGWEPNPAWAYIRTVAREHGFGVEGVRW